MICRDRLTVSAFISLQDFTPCFPLTTYIKLFCQFLILNISVSNIHASWPGITLLYFDLSTTTWHHIRKYHNLVY